MSFTIERSPYCVSEGHVTLRVQPAALDTDDWTPERAGNAVAVAGILGRVACEIDYSMRVQQYEHRCATDVRRFDDDLGEVVDGMQTVGCRHMLGQLSDEDAPQLRPFLLLVVPANREKSWRARVTDALNLFTRQNAITLTAPAPSA